MPRLPAPDSRTDPIPPNLRRLRPLSRSARCPHCFSHRKIHAHSASGNTRRRCGTSGNNRPPFHPASCRWRRIENTVCHHCFDRPGKYPGKFPRWSRNSGCKGLLQTQAIHQTTHQNIKSIRPGEVRESPNAFSAYQRFPWRQPCRCA